MARTCSREAERLLCERPIEYQAYTCSPEAIGLPCASLYILLLMLFIPFPFSHLLANSPARHVQSDDKTHGVGQEAFPHNEVCSRKARVLTRSSRFTSRVCYR